MKKLSRFALVAIGLSMNILASTLTVPLYQATESPPGPAIGHVTLTDTQYGLLIQPNLYHLPPGIHGFHLHQHPHCGNHALAAGGHLTHNQNEQHLGPYQEQGHIGDLPALTVLKDGRATLPVIAPRLTLTQVINHSLVIHLNGDNYSDHPKPLGGGGPRIACGAIHVLTTPPHKKV